MGSRSPDPAPLLDPGSSALLVDLYELTMAQALLDAGLADERACFSLFVRHLPPGWGFLVAAGLEDVLGALERLRFSQDDLAALEATGLFGERLLGRLERFRFHGHVHAMAEGTPFFPQEPLLEVSGGMLEAQLVETLLLNRVHLHTLLASKAARVVAAAAGRGLVDFSLRRAHGPDAGLAAARSSYLAGFASTSNVLAGSVYGIPLAGTMAHSFVQAFDDELEAFRAFAASYRGRAVLLVDTWDTPAGVRRAADLGRELRACGHEIAGVRLDSGDLGALARDARKVLDDAGLEGATVLASGGLEERSIAVLVASGAPIDAFGVGSSLGVAADAPVLDMAYKLVDAAGAPTLKLSTGKATWPGPKQVWRLERDGQAAGDVVTLADEPGPAGARPLLAAVMQHGVAARPEPLVAIRERHRREVEALPAAVRSLDAAPYPVAFGERLQALRDELSREARARADGTPPEPALRARAAPARSRGGRGRPESPA